MGGGESRAAARRFRANLTQVGYQRLLRVLRAPGPARLWAVEGLASEQPAVRQATWPLSTQVAGWGLRAGACLLASTVTNPHSVPWCQLQRRKAPGAGPSAGQCLGQLVNFTPGLWELTRTVSSKVGRRAHQVCPQSSVPVVSLGPGPSPADCVRPRTPPAALSAWREGGDGETLPLMMVTG